MINELTSEILFRCPCCQKLFCTDSADLSLDDAGIEFQCTNCSGDFYLSNQRAPSGMFQTSKRVQHEFVHCTKCNFLKNKQSDECPSCGVIETRYQDIVKLENPRLFELNKFWSSVVTDLTNDQIHQEFLNLAQSMCALNFAAQKYYDLQKIMGLDDLTEKYLKQIELRLVVTANNYNTSNKAKKTKNFNVSFKENFFGIEYSIRNMFLAISFIGVLFFIFNVMRPFLPSLNGVFVAIIVLSLGLWSISKNHTKTY